MSITLSHDDQEIIVQFEKDSHILYCNSMIRLTKQKKIKRRLITTYMNICRANGRVSVNLIMKKKSKPEINFICNAAMKNTHKLLERRLFQIAL